MFLFENPVGPAREGRVARLSKEDQARILVLVNEEHRPVRAVAAEMGCTPAAIYALLGRMRRESAGEEAAAEQAPLALGTIPAAPVAPPPAAAEPVAVSPQPAMAPRLMAAVPEEMPPRPAEQPAERPAGRPFSARLAKPGMGLVTRSADGDESVMPFRSLDDLLSAIKPILREGARSPEPVWFSLQAIDLGAIEADAA